MEPPSLSDWLGLTEQQTDILKTVYNLEHNQKPTSPKNITAEYERTHRKRILRPNLFNILKLLKEKNLIAKKTQGAYTTNFPGIQENIKTAGAKLEEKMREYQEVSKNAEQYFTRYATRIDRPEVAYYDQPQLYDKMTESLEHADKISITTSFPMIAYTKETTTALGTDKYAEKLWTRSNKEKKLQINYLTNLDIDHLFNHAFRTHGDPKLAYRECQTTLNRLETQTQTNPKLDIRHLQDPHSLDAAIIENKTPTELYLFIKDEHNDTTGAIHIKHKQTATNTQKQYQRNYEYAEKLNTTQGRKKIQTLHQTLKQKYGTLE